MALGNFWHFDISKKYVSKGLDIWHNDDEMYITRLTFGLSQ